MPTLFDSLRTTQQTNATAKSQSQIDQTISHATDFWIKERRGHGWKIFVIDLNLTYSILTEATYVSYQTTKKDYFTPMTLMGQSPTHTLFILETDYLSPTWLFPTILPRVDSTCRLLNIIRDFEPLD